MELEVRTTLVIISILSFTLAGFLALAGVQAKSIRGIWHFAAANLCQSMGLGLIYLFLNADPSTAWPFVPGATLVAAGVGLQFMGIAVFKGAPSRIRIVATILGLFFVFNVVTYLTVSDPCPRVIVNSLFFMFGYAACARSLFVRVDPPLRTAYLFTGVSFAMLAVLMLVRTWVLVVSPVGGLGLYEQLPINPAVFFLGVLLQFCAVFGFILMVDYRLIADIQAIAWQDALTGALNRRRLEEEASRLLARSRRTGDTLSVMMLDVDRFKAVNDQYGHAAGDEVLRRLAEFAMASVRADDYFARYGGEEFCVLLPSTTAAEALQLAERLREGYQALGVAQGLKTIKITVSIGVTDTVRGGLDFPGLLACADKALYRAKQNGRNKVVVFGGAGAEAAA